MGTDLKKTRVYQEAYEEEQQRILSIAVPALLERGMTVEEIADDCELPAEIIEAFVPQPE